MQDLSDLINKDKFDTLFHTGRDIFVDVGSAGARHDEL